MFEKKEIDVETFIEIYILFVNHFSFEGYKVMFDGFKNVYIKMRNSKDLKKFLMGEIDENQIVLEKDKVCGKINGHKVWIYGKNGKIEKIFVESKLLKEYMLKKLRHGK